MRVFLVNKFETIPTRSKKGLVGRHEVPVSIPDPKEVSEYLWGLMRRGEGSITGKFLGLAIKEGGNLIIFEISEHQ